MTVHTADNNICFTLIQPDLRRHAALSVILIRYRHAEL